MNGVPDPAWREALRAWLPEAPEAVLEVLQSAGRAGALAKGEAVLCAGQPWRDALWVQAGALRMYYLDAGGTERNKNFHLDGSWLWPLTPRMRDAPSGFFMAAIEPSRIWSLPLAVLAPAVQGLPSWAALQARTLAHLLDDKMQREQDFLQLDARARYAAVLHRYPAWAQRIPLRHLASFLGMTDVSLSRLRADMGLIQG